MNGYSLFIALIVTLIISLTTVWGNEEKGHDHKEDDGHQGEERNRRPQCERNCPQGGTQVCGSDGKTYANECTMRSESCQASIHVTKNYDGPCRPPCFAFCLPFYIPVCGSNGKTYNNEMCMKAESCQTGVLITKSSDGPCRQIPQCDENCPQSGRQICGTDGRTYPNRCVMRLLSCRAGTFVRKDHDGPCRSFGNERCNTNCPATNAPVCGSDGETYVNECFMRAESCIENTFVTKRHEGACRATGPRQCDTACPANYHPICASDGKTYSNECALRVVNCQDGTAFTKSHDGVCQADRAPNCETACPTTWAPVCGSDRITYTNRCQLNNRNCQLQKQQQQQQQPPQQRPGRGQQNQQQQPVALITVARDGDC